MERQVIQLAGKTLVVSLPSKWAKKFGVKKGDSLSVEERERSLFVSTSKAVEQKKAQVELRGPTELIQRSIDVAYKKGVDELELSFEEPKTMKAIEEALASTMGFEIISQGEKSCTIKSVATAIEEEFDNILRRVFLAVLAMAEESYDSISKSEFSRLAEIGNTDKTINKLTNFCKRVLNKKGYKESSLTNYVYCIVWEIERIADEYRRICSKINSSSKISKEAINIFKEANIMLREFYNLFYKFEQDKAISLTNKRNSIMAKINAMILKSKGNETLLLHYLSNIITSVYDIAGPYYAMVL